MSRSTRGRGPYIPPKLRVELGEENLVLRLFGLGLAILVAVLAFTYAINSMLSVPPGWQIIEPTISEKGIAGQFSLNYNIGAGEFNAEKEHKAVTNLYSQALNHAYQVLGNAETETPGSLWELNRHPNETVTVDPVLYRALETAQRSDTRLVYYAPLYEWYYSLFYAYNDETAMCYDPACSQESAQYVRELAAYAGDPQMVQVEMLPDNQVQLKVSEDYLAYAGENGLTSFVDFGFLLNAFLCDAAADVLAENGLTNGILSSNDGYVRVLCEEELVLPVYDQGDSGVQRTAEARYYGPAALVVCRRFPVDSVDEERFYRYADGTVLAPYIGQDGVLGGTVSGISALSRQGSVAELAQYVWYAMANDGTAELLKDEISCIITENGNMQLHGADFALQ